MNERFYLFIIGMTIFELLKFIQYRFVPFNI